MAKFVVSALISLTLVKPCFSGGFFGPSSDDQLILSLLVVGGTFVIPGITQGIGNSITNDNVEPGFGYTYLGFWGGALTVVGIGTILKALGGENWPTWAKAIGITIALAPIIIGPIVAYNIAKSDNEQALATATMANNSNPRISFSTRF